MTKKKPKSPPSVPAKIPASIKDLIDLDMNHMMIMDGDHAKLTLDFCDPKTKQSFRKTTILLWDHVDQGVNYHNAFVLSDHQLYRSPAIIEFIKWVRDSFGERVVTDLQSLAETTSGKGQITRSTLGIRLHLNKKDTTAFINRGMISEIFGTMGTTTCFTSVEQKNRLLCELSAWSREWACPDCHIPFEQSDIEHMVERQRTDTGIPEKYTPDTSNDKEEKEELDPNRFVADPDAEEEKPEWDAEFEADVKRRQTIAAASKRQRAKMLKKKKAVPIKKGNK